MQEIEKNPKNSIAKIVDEIFSSPIDLFDFFFQNSFSSFQILGIYLSLSILAPISKLGNNFLQFKLFPENSPPSITEGIFTSFLVYLIGLFFVIFLDEFGKNFLQRLGKKNQNPIALISFLPFAASSVFWLLPKPFLIIGLFLATLLGLFNYYEGFRNTYELNRKQFFSFILLFGIFLGALSFIFLLSVNLYRNL